ncbi:hypothetical protein EAF04_003530 [Stromatinia cepivora]|nr:hypothetical protein EAF04_003530 [Stromatinia cepivora]
MKTPTIPPKTASSLSTQRPHMGNPPLPPLAIEALWYGHEKKFNEFLNVPYSPFIIRHQKLSTSIGNNNINKTPPVPDPFPNLLAEKDLQNVKHKMISLLIQGQIKKLENVYGNPNKVILPRRLEGSDWSNESDDDALIDYYDARKDQIELDIIRVRVW